MLSSAQVMVSLQPEISPKAISYWNIEGYTDLIQLLKQKMLITPMCLSTDIMGKICCKFLN